MPGERDSFQVARGGQLHDLSVAKSQAAELRALITLRDGARALLNAEDATFEDTAALTAQRDQLRADYQ